MLGKRIATALIGIPVSAWIIHYGQWVLVCTVGILAFIAWQEFSAMLKKKQIFTWRSIGFLGILGLIGCAWLGNSQEMVFLSLLFTLIILMKPVFSGRTDAVNDVAFSILGIFYIGLAFSHLLLLRFTDSSLIIPTFFGLMPMGEVYLWLAFIGTWASDTFAYFIGSFLGKHKLCPAISPGKTIEGGIGGLLGSVGVVLAIGMTLHMPIQHGLALGILIGVAAPAGDLVESALKRFTGVKDSGNILPGHGGVLDRFDSILFTVPVVYYYIHGFIV